MVNDIAFLDRLDDRHWRAGIAEAIKVALIKDQDFLSWIIAHAADFPKRNRSRMRELIQRSATLHIDHITGGGDPFETGSSRPLDFGHWSAHRLEVLSRHRLAHGEAVAIGMAIDCCYAQAIGRLDGAIVALILDALETIGFALWDDVLSLRDASGRRSVLAGLEQFREHLGGQLTIAMPDGPGRRRDINSIDEALMDRCIQRLQRRASQAGATQRTDEPATTR